MAGPEPYPQVKWTREQEDAYAEGRASAKGETSKGGSAPRSGSKRKRYVRTQAGANRYHVPIGAEIGQARNAKAAESQKDTESTDRYGQLVGADARAQAEAMQSLNDSQVQRLAQVAYSFKSSNPDVVRLRMGVAAELKRRGFNVNDFGGLGGGSTRPAVSAKKKPVSASSSPTGGYYRMVRERKLSVPQLRKALGVFSKISPDKRQVVAKYLVGQAIELGVPHMLGRSVVELATPDQQRVIELSGSWKHGWIPLNATAVSEKMKGKTGGKQWWTTGGARTNKPRASVAVPKDTSGSHKTGLTHGQGVPSNARTGGRYAPVSKKRKPGVKGNAETMRRSVEAGKKARAEREARRVSSTRTDVVKSGSKPKEAPKMDLTGRTDAELNVEKRAIEGVSARKQPTKEMQRKYAAIKAELARRKAGTAGPGTGGRTTGETEFEKAAKARVARRGNSGKA